MSTVKVTRCLWRGRLTVATSMSVAPWLKFSLRLRHDYGLFGANVRPGYCVHEIRLTTQCTAPHSAGPRFNCTALCEFYLQAIPSRPADPLTRAVNVTPAAAPRRVVCKLTRGVQRAAFSRMQARPKLVNPRNLDGPRYRGQFNQLPA